MKLSSILTILLLFRSITCWAQNRDNYTEDIIEKRIEYLAEVNGELDVDYTTLFDKLSYYLDHPLNLNRSDVSELRSISLLTEIQLNNLVTHVENNGELIRLEELQSVEGFDMETIQLILPFVTITGKSSYDLSISKLLKKGNHETIIRYQRVLQTKTGFQSLEKSNKLDERKYLGDANKWYTRYSLKYSNRISLGLTTEKDPGEEFFEGSQKNGFDFYSGHIFYSGKGVLRKLAVGDYQVQFGQGLTYWSGIALGKSSDVLSVKRNATGLKPYRSTDENGFLRGLGTTIGLGKIEWTTFYSNNNIDANISEIDSVDGNDTFISLSESGYHRTLRELKKKDAVRLEQIGSRIAYKKRNMELGLIGSHRLLDAKVDINSRVYNLFRSSRSDNTNIGFDYNWVYGNINFFGEFSKTHGAGNAFVSGMLASLDPRLSVFAMYRNYQKDFHPISSAGIGAGSSTQNEKGWYLGIVTKPMKGFTISAYYDQFTFPWLKFRTYAPSRGTEYLIQTTYRPSKKLEIYFRVKNQLRSENIDRELDHVIPHLVDVNTTNYRYNIRVKVSETTSLQSRVEVINYNKAELPNQRGYLIYQDINYRPMSKPFAITFRYGIFDTDSYDARIYTYEGDLPYLFSTPAFYKRGIRSYIMLKYKLLSNTNVWVRYGITSFDNLDTIGSGLEEINGSTRSEIKVQLRIKF